VLSIRFQARCLRIIHTTIEEKAGASITELMPSLQSTKTVLAFFDNATAVVQQVDAAMKFVVQQQTHFNNFNRAIFITEYLNPLSTERNHCQKQRGIPSTTEERAICLDANTLFEADARLMARI
jgi:cytochrome c peroxidase